MTRRKGEERAVRTEFSVLDSRGSVLGAAGDSFCAADSRAGDEMKGEFKISGTGWLCQGDRVICRVDDPAALAEFVEAAKEMRRCNPGAFEGRFDRALAALEQP